MTTSLKFIYNNNNTNTPQADNKKRKGMRIIIYMEIYRREKKNIHRRTHIGKKTYTQKNIFRKKTYTEEHIYN